MSWVRRALDKVGTGLVVLLMLLGGGLVWWNVCGQQPYRSECSWTGGCRSFMCLEHGLRGDQQVSANGRCTKECSADDECGDGFRCVALGADARDDLPPFGKPDRACMRVLEP